MISRNVNGEPVDLATDVATIASLPDRLAVHHSGRTDTALVVRDGKRVLVSYLGNQYVVEPKASSRRESSAESSSGELTAPMPGQITDVRVELNANVKKGDVIVVMEAMKTQQPLVAPFDGVVASISVTVREQVNEGAVVAVVVPIMTP